MAEPGQIRNPPAIPGLYQRAVLDAFTKLDPRSMIRNPVMFTVEIGSVITTLLWLQALTGKGEAPAGFIGAISAWLWFTVLFANFAEALAEGRGKAQAFGQRFGKIGKEHREPEPCRYCTDKSYGASPFPARACSRG